MELKGLRVLMVEDQAMIAMDMLDFLRDRGCVIVGPVGTLEAAAHLACTQELDAAILDVSLHDGEIYPVADLLRTRGIPFLFATGYGESTLPKKWRGQPRLSKPFLRVDLERMLGSLAG